MNRSLKQKLLDRTDAGGNINVAVALSIIREHYKVGTKYSLEFVVRSFLNRARMYREGKPVVFVHEFEELQEALLLRSNKDAKTNDNHN